MRLDALDAPLLAFTEEVEDALAERRPLVALESTLLAHGLPAPERARVAHALEAAVRAEGAVPATIAILDGRFRVGLDPAGLERVVGGGVEKASLRDLAPAVVKGGVWATTVASTMAIAHRAGISLFATGGIGGVHRGAEETFDESADLAALARFPVGVVCAGAKSVLDLPRTLERLETLGVPVVGFGCDELPAFYHGCGGLRVPTRLDDEVAVARLLAVHFFRLQGAGVLIAQPPPAALAQDPARVDALIEAALAGARASGVRGREVTPFLLAALDRASGGDVVRTNVALVEANARLAARVAVALRGLEGDAGA